MTSPSLISNRPQQMYGKTMSLSDEIQKNIRTKNKDTYMLHIVYTSNSITLANQFYTNFKGILHTVQLKSSKSKQDPNILNSIDRLTTYMLALLHLGRSNGKKREEIIELFLK